VETLKTRQKEGHEMEQELVDAIVKAVMKQLQTTPDTLPFETEPESRKPVNSGKRITAKEAEQIIIDSATKTAAEIAQQVGRTQHAVECILCDARGALKERFSK
jgi:predicted transcriptional regulator